MIKTRAIEVPATPARTREEHTRFCDLCGAAVRGRHEQPGYGFDVVTIARENGYSVPGSGDCATRLVDCCVGCFESKVEPALEALGFVWREEEYDW